jgi:hypothetical protein
MSRAFVRPRWLALLALALLLVAGACDSSDNSERLAAQRLFRNFLLTQVASAEADVRIEGFVDELPPDFPLLDDMDLLGSAFSDTDDSRRLIVGWETDVDADEVFEFYNDALGDEPWSIVANPRVRGIDFIRFQDADNHSFEGEVRINQEDKAVVILIADVDLRAAAGQADETQS